MSTYFHISQLSGIELKPSSLKKHAAQILDNKFRSSLLTIYNSFIQPQIGCVDICCDQPNNEWLNIKNLTVSCVGHVFFPLRLLLKTSQKDSVTS